MVDNGDKALFALCADADPPSDGEGHHGEHMPKSLMQVIHPRLHAGGVKIVPFAAVRAEGDVLTLVLEECKGLVIDVLTNDGQTL